jgi:hypothetical protein
MSFGLSFHQALPGPTGAHWLDDPSDVSCKDSTRQHPVDDPLLSCKQMPLGTAPTTAPLGFNTGVWRQHSGWLARLLSDAGGRAATVRWLP